MPLFEYKAIGEDGRPFKGVLDADSLTVAKEKIRREKVFITSIGELAFKGKKLSLNSSQLLAFTRELSQLLKAGLPLYDSLLTIEEKHRKSLQHPLFADLCDKLKTGSSFSNALSRYPETFSEIYLSMVHAAEQSGSLHEIFEQLTLLLLKQQKLKKQLISALAYPSFLGAFCFLVIGALFFFVVPSMKELFEGRTLHPLTQTVLSISNFVNAYAEVLFSSMAVLIVSLYFLSRNASFQKKLGVILLKTPYIKKILLESALVRLFRAMHMLLAGGVPLVQSIRFSQQMVKSVPVRDLLVNIEKEIIQGRKMSELFAEAPFIPPLVTRMLSIGEETGGMGSMMFSMAEIYEEELDKDLLQLMTFLQPAVLIFLGAVVGLVVLSVLLPLTDVSSFVSS